MRKERGSGADASGNTGNIDVSEPYQNELKRPGYVARAFVAAGAQRIHYLGTSRNSPNQVQIRREGGFGVANEVARLA